MVALFKYDDLGRALTKAEMDGNWTQIETALNDVLAGVLPVAAIELVATETAQYLRFLDDEGSVLADVPFPAMLAQGGAWATGVAYDTRHFVSHAGATYICAAAHTANDFDEDLAASKWFILGSSTAESLPFVPGDSGLESDTINDAVVELAGKVNDLDALHVAFDPAGTDLTSTTVQGAIAEIAVAGGGGDVAAADVDITPITGVTGANVQAALEDLKIQVDAAGGSAPAASAVTMSAITGVDTASVQTAIADLKTQVDSGGGATPDAEDIAITAISGMTSDNVQDALAELKTAIGSGGGGSVAASAVTMSAISGVDTSSVQAAIADLKGEINGVKAITDVVQYAEGIAYDDAISGSGTSDVQGTLDELFALIAALTARVDTLESA